MTGDIENSKAGSLVIARDTGALPDSFTRGGEIPDDLNPFADGILMAHQR